MAQVELDVKLDAAAAAKTIAELRKALKDLINEQQNVAQGTKEWSRLAESINETEGKIGDLTDSFSTLKGSGIERVEASLGILREGFTKFDTGKISSGFRGLAGAMSAIPIFLLVEGVKLLFDNFDKGVEVFKTITGLFSDNELKVKSLNKELEKQQKINQTATAELENEIKVLEAKGKSDLKILQAKKELNALKIKELEIDANLQKARVQEIIDNDTLYETYLRKSAALVKTFGDEKTAAEITKQIDINKKERAEEALKKFKEDIITINNLKTQDRVDEINYEKQQKEKAKEARASRREDAEDAANVESELREKKRKLLADELLLQKQIEDEKLKKLLDAKAEKERIDQSIREATAKQYDEENKKLLEQDALKKSIRNSELELAKQSIQAIQGLSDVYFQNQLIAAKDNEAKQIEIKKKAFQVNKAFQASQAIIDGYRAVLSAYATAPPGFKTISAVAAGVFAAANVAKILATKFDAGPSKTDTPTEPNTKSVGSGGSQNPSQQQIPTRPQANTEFDDSGRRKNTTEVVIYQSQIKDAGRTQTRIEQQAKF